MYDDISIPVFIISLKECADRLAYILDQFVEKKEFDTHLVEVCTHENYRIGLWQSIVKAINDINNGDDDVVVICTDNHTFTENYNRDILIRNIIEASEQSVELLLGGIGGFGNAVPITSERYWIDWFWCTQFMVLYRPIFLKILNYRFKDEDTVDGVLSELTTHKMVLYPFISVQHDFGYSDVTLLDNRVKNKVAEGFKKADEKMRIYQYANLKFL